MKNAIIAVALILVNFLTPQRSEAAAVCLMPSPFCAVVMGVTGLIVIAGEGKTELKKIKIADQEADLKSINSEIASVENGDYLLRMANNWGRYNPGYSTIVGLYNEGRIQGSVSLQSTKEFAPKLFKDLDVLANILAKNAGQKAVTTAYGPREVNGNVQWEHYVMLAQDAQIIYHNTFHFRN